MTITRRNFARLAATSGAAAVASPAIAQGAIKWRLASSFPKSLEGLWGASPTLAKYVNEMSDGKFTIDPFAAGEIVPGLQVLDAVANGTVECGHSYGGYYIGKAVDKACLAIRDRPAPAARIHRYGARTARASSNFLGAKAGPTWGASTLPRAC